MHTKQGFIDNKSCRDRDIVLSCFSILLICIKIQLSEKKERKNKNSKTWVILYKVLVNFVFSV